MRTTDTKIRILVEGRNLLQRHGYNGFSFLDIAQSIGLKKPSLYEHFESKESLGLAVIEDYRQRFAKWSEAAAKERTPAERIEDMFGLFYKFARDGKKFCPIAALSGDMQGLPSSMRKQMREFSADWLTFLNATVKEGQAHGAFRKDLSADHLARLLVALALGSQMASRIENDPELLLQLNASIQSLLSSPMGVKDVEL